MAGKTSQIFRRIVQLWLDAESVRRTKAGLQDALNKGTDVKGLKKNFRAADAAMAALRRTALGLGASFLAIFSSRKLLDYAESWKLIQGRLKLVTTDTKNLAAVTQSLQGIATRTRTSFEDVARLYSRVAMNADQLGRSQQEVLDLTETVSKSIQIGGATASEAAAGVQQLAQALASGRLQGDEFRSIMENMPDLARRLSRELGVTVGELRAMSKAGELTSDVLVEAMLRMRDAVDEDFKSVPVTLSGAFKVLGNNIMEFVGETDEATGATGGLASAILGVAGAIDKVTEARKRARTENSFSERLRQLTDRPAVMGDLRIAEGRDAREAAEAAERERLRPFNELLSRLESERTSQLVKLKAAGAATAEEVAELNKLYADGNAMLRAGNLLVEQRHDLVSALASMGFKEVEAKTAEELLKLEDERIKMLVEAHELGLATKDEEAELVAFQERFVRLLAEGNAGLADRLRAAEHLKEINDTLEGRGMFRRAPDPITLANQAGMGDLLAGRRDRDGSLQIRAPQLAEIQSQDLAETYRQQWLDANADVLEAAQNAAFGVVGAWSDALGLLRQEGEGLAGFLETLFRGLAGAALGGLAQYASAKVAENIALAIEESAKAAGAAASFPLNPLGLAQAAGHATAASGHKLAAIKWGLLGGAAGAAQAAVAGGGRGGVSGGIPSGARDPAGRVVDRLSAPQTITIVQYIDGIDPKNGTHQVKVGEAVVNYEQRTGSKITDGARRRRVG